MATPVTYPSAKRFLGTAKEVTQGTAVVPITWTHPLDSFDPEDQFTWLDDKSLVGSMAETRGRIQGVGHVEAAIGGPMFCDGIGFWLNNILGDLTTTVATPNSHAFSLLNSGTAQPGSLTGVDWQGPPASSNSRTYPGMCLSELTLKGNAANSFITWSGKISGYPSAITGAAQTSAPTTVPTLAAWRARLGIGGPAAGGTLVKTMDEWEVTITRAISVEWTAQNSQVPFIIQRGALGVTGSFHFSKPADESAYLPLINNTQPQVQLLADNGGSGAGLLSLQIDMQVTAWDTGKINRGDEAVGYDIGYVAIANSTNAGASGATSPIKVTIQNSVAAATY